MTGEHVCVVEVPDTVAAVNSRPRSWEVTTTAVWCCRGVLRVTDGVTWVPGLADAGDVTLVNPGIKSKNKQYKFQISL